jgi:hypothetical protein
LKENYNAGICPQILLFKKVEVVTAAQIGIL